MTTGGVESASFAGRSPRSEADLDPVLIGVSPVFRQVLAIIDTVAANDCVVLLEGESGTGKELLARRVHARAPRTDGPFVPVNCPAISESLFESQFYGHVKGAFTGAAGDTLGVVRAAEGGTLLLDEVGELPLHLQPKLLRLIQEREVFPVGAARPIAVDTRFIASTNRTLARAVAEGRFRSDLYHRLNVVRIEIPPLRARPEDIEPVLEYYLSYFASLYRMPPREISPYLRARLREYSWPGNVRELCGYVERLYAANLPASLPAAESWQEQSGRPAPIPPAPGRMPETAPAWMPSSLLAPSDETIASMRLSVVEANAIRKALEMTGYNRSATARLLAIHRSTLLRKMRLHGLDFDK